jgi:hypothetical protein
MHISILGDTTSQVEADMLAEELAVQLCVPVHSDARKPIAEYKLLVTASPVGTAEAVRRGAAKGAARYVTTYSLGPPHPDVLRGREVKDGFHFRKYTDPLERLYQLESASILIFLAINRRNVGLLLNTLYSLNEELKGITGLTIEQRKILLWSGVIANNGNRELTVEVLQHFLGSTIDATDVQKIHLFHTTTEAVTMVGEYSAQLTELFKPK